MPTENSNVKTSVSSSYFQRSFERPLSDFELKTLSEIDIWYEYIRLKSSSGSNAALQELLKRHDSFLIKIAKNSQGKYNLTSDFEDKLQHARYAAMRAYDKFDIEKAKEAGAQLSSYVCNCATKYLQSANDTDSFIDCPPARRIIRSYLWGRYDNDLKKKAEVEARLGIRTLEDRQELMKKFEVLLSTFLPIDIPSDDSNLTHGELIRDDSCDLPSDIESRLQLQLHMQKLSARQRKVLTLFSSGYKMREIADALNVTEIIVRGDIRTIRVIMKRCFAADNKEEMALMQNI